MTILKYAHKCKLAFAPGFTKLGFELVAKFTPNWGRAKRVFFSVFDRFISGVRKRTASVPDAVDLCFR